MYTALYRAERPETFSEVIGQDHIVRILTHQIETDTVSHAYLFCGTRGTGKTSTARILAKAVNCTGEGSRPCGQCPSCRAIRDGNFMDVIEIDAASNNGVDNIRELRESVKYPPAAGRKKVYIIDEVHMLSTGAFNALLKTLEEPPENVMFILATTDPQKLPQTILSRCMRLDFRRVSEETLISHMSRIVSQRGIQVTDAALRLLAANADGSVRDGLSLLDQCMSGGDKTLDRDTVLDFLGTVSEDFFLELTDRVSLADNAGALVLLDEALRDGKDVKLLMKDWMSHYRNLLITKYIRNPEDMINMSSENVEKLRNQSDHLSLDEISRSIMTLSRTINDARYSTQPRILLELAIVTIASGLSDEQTAMAPAKPQPRRQTAMRRSAEPRAPQRAQSAQSAQRAVNPAPQSVQRAAEAQGAPDSDAQRAAKPASQSAQAAPEYIADQYVPQPPWEEETAEQFIPPAAPPWEEEPAGGFVPSPEPEMMESPAEPAAPGNAEPAEMQDDIDQIWHDFIEEGKSRMGSFNMLSSGAFPGGIRGNEFKIIVVSPFLKNYIEEHQDLVTEILDKAAGRRLRVICVEDGQQNAEPEEKDDIGQLAKELESRLGLEIEIK